MVTVLSSKQNIIPVLSRHQNIIWNPGVVQQKSPKLQLAFAVGVCSYVSSVRHYPSCCSVRAIAASLRHVLWFICPGGQTVGSAGSIPPCCPMVVGDTCLDCTLQSKIRKRPWDPLSRSVVKSNSHSPGVWKAGEGRMVCLLCIYTLP